MVKCEFFRSADFSALPDPSWPPLPPIATSAESPSFPTQSTLIGKWESPPASVYDVVVSLARNRADTSGTTKCSKTCMRAGIQIGNDKGRLIRQTSLNLGSRSAPNRLTSRFDFRNNLGANTPFRRRISQCKGFLKL